ncbi:hypothetical protein BDZ45DRAFT_755381 [Acephala macrosclerotiorum]|nr:hypothetical protein BDZ45DRAFT_755381 [Acephala macrosclerotiorum]
MALSNLPIIFRNSITLQTREAPPTLIQVLIPKYRAISDILASVLQQKLFLQLINAGHAMLISLITLLRRNLAFETTAELVKGYNLITANILIAAAKTWERRIVKQLVATRVAYGADLVLAFETGFEKLHTVLGALAKNLAQEVEESNRWRWLRS